MDLVHNVKIGDDNDCNDYNIINNFTNINYEEKSNSFIGTNKLIKVSINITFEY